ncbi:unnamed protein product, partial [Closterium sp. NIES-54]
MGKVEISEDPEKALLAWEDEEEEDYGEGEAEYGTMAMSPRDRESLGRAECVAGGKLRPVQCHTSGAVRGAGSRFSSSARGRPEGEEVDLCGGGSRSPEDGLETRTGTAAAVPRPAEERCGEGGHAEQEMGCEADYQRR